MKSWRARAARGYEATVEELLNPESQPAIQDDILMRYQPQWVSKAGLEGQQEEWTYRMINTKRPLEEKIALFWHHIFCTGHAKCEYPKQQNIELDMFRTLGFGNFEELLMGLSTDPAMVFYLDNCMSHKDAINENWGRELLELFSLGVGMDGNANYSEDDVKEAARAFTGWTVTNSIPRYPYGKYEAAFIYDPLDHDYGEKTFLGRPATSTARTSSRSSPGSRRRPVRRPAHVQLLRRRRAAGSRLAEHAAARPRSQSRCWKDDTSAPTTTSAPCCGCCSTPTSSRTLSSRR